ncbi:Multiple epidermal growth factor-like domains protein 8, partial [Homalodisca vitripennis]
SSVIQLVIDPDISVTCGDNSVYVYDGLPDFVSMGTHQSQVLGVFCTQDTIYPVTVEARSAHFFLKKSCGQTYRDMENQTEKNFPHTQAARRNVASLLSDRLQWCSPKSHGGACTIIKRKLVYIQINRYDRVLQDPTKSKECLTDQSNKVFRC